MLYTPLESYRKKNEKLLIELCHLNVLENNVKNVILDRENRIYGLLKTHKADQPIRPVVNTINTPGYFIAKMLLGF